MNDNVVRLDLGLINTINDVSHTAAGTGFYFHTDELTRLREALVRSMLESMVVNIVIGTQGSGKTALLEQLLQHASSDWSLCLIKARHALGAQHILDQLNNRYFPHQAYSLEALVDHFLMAENQMTPVIVVDDAHNLSSFALESLLFLKHALEEQDKRCGVVLFARPAIRHLLTTYSLARYDESLRIIDIPLLSQVQTDQYIQQYLAMAGMAGSVNFSSAQRESVYRVCQGRVGRINEWIAQIAHKKINGTPWRNIIISLLDKHRRNLMLAGLVLAGIVTISVRIIHDEKNGMPSTMQADSAAETVITMGNARQQDASAQLRSGPHSVAESNQGEDQNRGFDLKSTKAGDQMPGRQSQQQTVTPTVQATAADQAAIQPAKRMVMPATDLPLAAATLAQNQSRPDLQSPAQTPIPIAAQPSAKQQATQFKHASAVTGEAWLMAQSGRDYTVQLAASAYGQAIEEFIHQQPVLDGLRSVKVRRRGDDWYVVLYGAFSSITDAKNAIDSLPATLRKNEPWVRQISHLQEMLVQTPSQPASQPVVEPSIAATAPAQPQSTLPGAVSAVNLPSADASTDEPADSAIAPPLMTKPLPAVKSNPSDTLNQQ